MNPELTPVLTPFEENRFKESSQLIKTSNRDMYLLIKKGNGNCIFLDDETRRCTIYERRPLECRLFPVLLNFEESTIPDIRLAYDNCPHFSTLIIDKGIIFDYLRQYKFDKKWVEGYNSLSGV